MPLYALATIPMINKLSIVKQLWYADDASASGHLVSIREWWDKLKSLGPSFGYHVNASKTWLVTKECHLSEAKEIFQDAEIGITSQGRPYLGTAIGSADFIAKFVSDKVDVWREQLQTLFSTQIFLLLSHKSRHWP